MTYRYRVRNWDSTFECAETRKLERLYFVRAPNKQHGMGFTRVMLQADGAAILGIWYLIIEACSQQRLPRLGWLTDDGTASGVPWTIEDMALRWRRTPQELARALEVLCSARIAWMETVESSPVDLPATSHQSPGETPTEESSQEERRGEETCATPTPPSVEMSKEDRRRTLRSMLARKQFASDDTALEEWGGLIADIAQAKTMQEAADFLLWLKAEARREGITGRYSPPYEGLAARWRQQRQAKRKGDEGAA